jgi:nuclear transcription Y subunit beta
VSADPNIELVPIDDREQDKFLPIANISRIMKRALPANAKIAKDAKETVQECVSEFISFITSEASDKCQREKRKTIMGDDLLWAMSTLGFENYTEPLKTYLFRYREVSIKTGGKEGGDDAAAGGGAGGADGSGGGEDAASPKGSADDAGNS